MPVSPVTRSHLNAVAGAQIFKDVPLAGYTRFALGGPASLLFDTDSELAFVEALKVMSGTDDPRVVIGGGTNLVVADAGFDGVVLRYTGNRMERQGITLQADAGAVLQSVVDFSILQGLKGLETMTGIPGYLGGAVYGNAGAYGRSIHQMAERVRFAVGGEIREFDNAAVRVSVIARASSKGIRIGLFCRPPCALTKAIRESWRRSADEIRTLRDAKYPPTMKCAGSIFKNSDCSRIACGCSICYPGQDHSRGQGSFCLVSGANGRQRFAQG